MFAFGFNTFSQVKPNSRSIPKATKVEKKETRPIANPADIFDIKADYVIVPVSDFHFYRYEKFEKDEFETQADYLKRLDKLVSEETFRDIPLKNIIFTATPEVTYNAEINEFNICVSIFKGPVGVEFKRLMNGPLANELYKNSCWSNYSYNLTLPREKAKEMKDNFLIGFRGIPLEDHKNPNDIYFLPKEIFVINKTDMTIYEDSRKKVNRHV